MINYRLTQKTDIPEIMHIVTQAQEYFKNKDIDQWQNGYPNEETFIHDIEKNHSYVFLSEDRVIATAMISFDGESTYDQIEGTWLNDEPFAVVHRIAVDSEFKGQNIAGQILDIAQILCRKSGIVNIRVDTHRENLSMQRALEKWGFCYCGIIYLKDGAERLAYQWSDDKL